MQDPPRDVLSPIQSRRCRESRPVPRFSSNANVWAGYGRLFFSGEVDENFQFRPDDSQLTNALLPYERQPSAMSVTIHRSPPSPRPPPRPPPPPPPSTPTGPTVGELALAAEVRALEEQVKLLTLDKNHAECVLHALVDYHVHKYMRQR